MSYGEIIDDFPKITKEDIMACLSFTAEREQNTLRLSAWDYYSIITCHINCGIANERQDAVIAHVSHTPSRLVGTPQHSLYTFMKQCCPRARENK